MTSSPQKVVNTVDQLRHWQEFDIPAPVAIMKSWGGTNTTPFRNGWIAYHLTEKTDPEGSWYNYGRKHFPSYVHEGSFYESHAAALVDAQVWVADKYGVENWERNLVGDWVPKPLNKHYKIRRRPNDQ